MNAGPRRITIAAVVTLACIGHACGPVTGPPLAASNLQTRTAAPTAGRPAPCSAGRSELADLNRQIARLSKVIVAAKAELRTLRASAGYVAAKECRGKCGSNAGGATASAQKIIAVTEQNCQNLLQSLAALEQIRSDLIEDCPAHLNLPLPPVMRTCRE